MILKKNLIIIFLSIAMLSGCATLESNDATKKAISDYGIITKDDRGEWLDWLGRYGTDTHLEFTKNSHHSRVAKEVLSHLKEHMEKRMEDVSDVYVSKLGNQTVTYISYRLSCANVFNLGFIDPPNSKAAFVYTSEKTDFICKGGTYQDKDTYKLKELFIETAANKLDENGMRFKYVSNFRSGIMKIDGSYQIYLNGLLTGDRITSFD